MSLSKGVELKICTVSFKECWRSPEGRWYSTGGFPLQINAIGDLFDQKKLVTVETSPSSGGIPIAADTTVVGLRSPCGVNFRRKVSVITQLPYYLRNILREVREADAVYIPVPGDLPLLGLAAAIVLRKYVISRYCGSWVTNSQTTIVNRVTKTVLRWTAGGRHVVLVAGVGDAAPAPQANWMPSTALSQAELDGMDARVDRQLNNPPRLVCIGRLAAGKNIPQLVEVMSRLKAERFQPLPVLTVVGDGPDRKRLESLVKERNCTELVRFAGQIDRRALSRQLAAADLCVHASASEGSPKAWLDAMAYGLPVLAADVPGARWPIGEDGERGWLVPQNDVAAFASALEKILTIPRDWPALRRRCRAHAETRTLETWRKQIGEICARQWGMSLVDGKLRARLPERGTHDGRIRRRERLSRAKNLSGVQQVEAK